MPEAALTEPSPRPIRIVRGGWLDALRFIVGALIILYHFREAAPVPLGQLHPVFERGYLLTDFFIIDSGYVLARIYGDRLASGQASLRAYARQRLLRVIPAHLAVSVVLVLLVGGAALAGIGAPAPWPRFRASRVRSPPPAASWRRGKPSSWSARAHGFWPLRRAWKKSRIFPPGSRSRRASIRRTCRPDTARSGPWPWIVTGRSRRQPRPAAPTGRGRAA